MNISGKGILIILLFLVIIPAGIDLILLSVIPVRSTQGVSMSRSLFSGYGRLIPFYIFYLILAFTVLYGIKEWRKRTTRKK